MESIRIGDIQVLHLKLNGVNPDAVQRVAVAGINNGKTKFYIPPEKVLIDVIQEDDVLVLVAKIIIGSEIAWSLQEGSLKLQVKINYMPDENGDGVYNDQLPGDYGTQTTQEVEFKVLPTLFKPGDVTEGDGIVW